GGYKGLTDAVLMSRKAAEEQALRDRVAASAKKQEAYGSAWDKIAEAQKVSAEIILPNNLLERGIGFDSHLFTIARQLVRLAAESAKPNPERLREYRDTALDSLKLSLFSEAPIYPEYESARLAHSLNFWKKKMGADDPLVQRVLQGRS